LHIPIAHVEAGLRSYNRQMPEELNRVLTDHMADLLFCPTIEAVHNLTAEGIHRNVHCIGDVMFDCFLTFSNIAKRKSKILQTLPIPHIDKKQFGLATVHRAENTDDPKRLANIFAGLNETGYPIILPLHPRTKKILSQENIVPQSNIYVVEPLSYLDMCLLLQKATLVLTDSGGLQKEAFFARVPCITLRDETEWRETVACGWNKVVGTDKHDILAAVESFRNNPPLPTDDLYGSGDAAQKIISILDAQS
jgi:UDP-GlcNAc3NAcA epimerase